LLNAPLDNLYFCGDIEVLRQFAENMPKEFVLSDGNNSKKVIADIAASKNDISKTLLKNYSNSLQKAVESVFGSNEYDDKYFNIQQQLIANVNRFAAHKAYLVTQSVKRQVADADGVERSQTDFYKYAQKVLNTANRYQAAEYHAAIARSRTAKQWQEFGEDTEIENLKWLPSRSADPREAHKKFYGLVLPKNHPFWQHNQPGNLWNCKCDWEETFENTSKKMPPVVPAAKGLDGNPFETGKIFSDNASYFKAANKQNESIANANKQYKQHLQNIKDYVKYDVETYQHDGFNNNGGYLVTERNRITQAERNKQEKKKFDKEHDMCETLRANGYAVEYFAEKSGSYDIRINGIAADLKKTASHNNIVDYAKKAVRKQGAEIVVFEFEKMTNKIHEELNKLKKTGIKVLYFTTNNKEVIAL
jgi:hypothetical protein